ncbi:MAG TPA: hypothetical protein VEI50_16655 [Nitrospiraceae bacterium]|nr:hypothetical protein [Nitrospiraceae bacterium]
MLPQLRLPLTVLGSGYTGRCLAAVASNQGRAVLCTSRDPDRQLTHLAPSQRLRFDLAQPDTWTNTPPGADLIWCFPATPLELVQVFAKTLGAPPRRLLVLGSTSAYDIGDSHEYPPPWIDESAAIDLRKPRVKGEEYLRKEHGAIVLRVAGIYGPGRNPLDWIRSGRVGPSRRYVNLIHVEDLAAICLAALARGESGEVYNVSDGTPRTWADICRMAQTHWGVTAHKGGNDSQMGKRITTIALRERLGAVIRHPDLQAELEKLEGMRR